MVMNECMRIGWVTNTKKYMEVVWMYKEDEWGSNLKVSKGSEEVSGEEVSREGYWETHIWMEFLKSSKRKAENFNGRKAMCWSVYTHGESMEGFQEKYSIMNGLAVNYIQACFCHFSYAFNSFVLTIFLPFFLCIVLLTPKRNSLIGR